jgi:cytochrome c-type biogenesis protein
VKSSFTKGDFISTFVLGLSSGFVVAPCTTPVLGSILVLLSHKSNVLYGGFLLLCFAYGMGAILLISAVFSTFLTTLPKAGAWMGILKKTYAFILIAAGAYFIINALRRLIL